MMAFGPVPFGTTLPVGCEFSDKWDPSATIVLSNVTCTIIKPDGTKTRNAVAAQSDDTTAYYVETWSAANGYAEDTTYTVVFRATATVSGTAFAVECESTVRVLAVADQ